MAYRWEKASGGEIPADAYVKAHAYAAEDGVANGPLYARTLPDENGAVRLGYVERGQPARFGRDRVDEYEVLLDRGTWKPDDGDNNPPADRVVCGHNAERTPLYAAVADEEEWGTWPRDPVLAAKGRAVGGAGRCRALRVVQDRGRHHALDLPVHQPRL